MGGAHMMSCCRGSFGESKKSEERIRLKTDVWCRGERIREEVGWAIGYW